jgi:hypothetical protein
MTGFSALLLRIRIDIELTLGVYRQMPRAKMATLKRDQFAMAGIMTSGISRPKLSRQTFVAAI